MASVNNYRKQATTNRTKNAAYTAKMNSNQMGHSSITKFDKSVGQGVANRYFNNYRNSLPKEEDVTHPSYYGPGMSRSGGGGGGF